MDMALSGRLLVVLLVCTGTLVLSRVIAPKGEAEHIRRLLDHRKEYFLAEDALTSQGAGEENVDSPRFSISCEVCKLLVFTVQDLIKTNASQEDIVKISTAICIDFKIEDKRVCDGITKEFREEVISVLTAVYLTPDEVCGTLLGDSCAVAPGINPQNWTVPILNTTKPPYVPIKPPAQGSPVSKFLYLSDIHYDSKYAAGSLAECDEPICCRAYLGPGDAGVYGSYHCDSPVALLENALEHVAKAEKFDYVIFTGDVPAHNVWNQSREDITSAITFTCDLFSKYLPDAKIYPAVGNHESSPVNSFPPPFVTGKDSHQWLRDSLAKNWGRWLPADTQETIKKGGYYSTLVRPGLRIISLNMNYGESGNLWLLINNTDPAGQLAWMRDQLQAAESAGEKVQIIGHQPPSSGMKGYSWAYHKIVNRYASTVIAQIFGHAHVDKMAVFFDEEDRNLPVGTIFIGPSLTPDGGGDGLNPAYRIFTQDGDHAETTHALLDQETHILNISQADITKVPTWSIEYSATEAYGMKGVQPADWADLIKRMETDDSLVQKYYLYKFHSHSKGVCDASCKKSVLCEMKTSRSSDPSQCADMTTSEYAKHLQLTAFHDRC